MKKIDCKEWKEYSLENLFQFVNSRAYHNKDVEATSTEGINYITRSKFNNGLCCKVVLKNKYIINPCGTISFGAENADFFYQEEPYITGNKMYYINTQHLSKNACLFLKTILQSTFTKNFSFSDGMIPDRIKKEKIILPSVINEDDSYTPDWEYMENYMTNIKQLTKQKFNKIKQIKQEKNKINTKQWKEFKIGELFPQIVKPGVLHSREIIQDTNGIPYVVRSKFNNGIKCYAKYQANMKPSPGGVISFGAENATFFYQAQEFISGRDIYYIDTTKYSRKVCFFIISCLKTLSNKYSYNFGMFPDLLKEDIIKFPVDDAGHPDWKYMEDYITKIEKKAENRLRYLIRI